MREIFASIVFLVALTSGGSSVAPPDPFGGNTTKVLADPLVTDWQAISGELVGDHALLGACVDSTETEATCVQGRALWKIIDEAKERRGLTIIGYINRAINLSIVPFEPSEWLTTLDAMHGC